MRPTATAGLATCPYCRDGLEGATRTLRCRACKVVLHTECAGARERCPTLGCGRALPAPLPGDRPATRTGRRSVADPVPWPPRPPAWERGCEEPRPGLVDGDLSDADTLTALVAILGLVLVWVGAPGLLESLALGRALTTLGACAVGGALLRLAVDSARQAAPPLALLAAGGALWSALPALPLGLPVAGLGAGWVGVYVLAALAEVASRR